MHRVRILLLWWVTFNVNVKGDTNDEPFMDDTNLSDATTGGGQVESESGR